MKELLTALPSSFILPPSSFPSVVAPRRKDINCRTSPGTEGRPPRRLKRTGEFFPSLLAFRDAYADKDGANFPPSVLHKTAAPPVRSARGSAARRGGPAPRREGEGARAGGVLGKISAE